MAGAFLHGLDIFAVPVDGLPDRGGKSRSRSPSSPALSTCAGSQPSSSFSSPESLHCESSSAPALELPWVVDPEPSPTVGVIEVQQVPAPPESSARALIAPPPGLETVWKPDTDRQASHGHLPPLAGPSADGALAFPPGLPFPPHWQPQGRPAVPPAPAQWAPAVMPGAGSPPPPPAVPPAPMAPAEASLPPQVPPPPAAPAAAFLLPEAFDPPAAPREAPGGPLAFPSVGSAEHRFGMCKPCAFYHTKGCDNGHECVFCHLCGPKEMSRRKKEKKIERHCSDTARGAGRLRAVARRQ